MINSNESRLFARSFSKLFRALSRLHADDLVQIKTELEKIWRDNNVPTPKALLVSHFLEALGELEKVKATEERKTWNKNVEKWK